MKLEADIMHNAHTANLFKQLEILPLEQLILKMLYDHYHICTTSGFAAIGVGRGCPQVLKKKIAQPFTRKLVMLRGWQ